MSRVFRRGELKQAILLVVSDLGDAHGYAILGELKTRVGGGWKGSPGAIYPALLALVETGHLESREDDGVQVYSLTDAGQRLVDSSDWAQRWPALSERANKSEPRVAIGRLLDDFASNSPLRRRLADPTLQAEIEKILVEAHEEIDSKINEGEVDG
jgi:DNA-binding PadR family transcriptional regulator